MAAALKRLHLQEVVVLDDDTETMVGLVGKRVAEIKPWRCWATQLRPAQFSWFSLRCSDRSRALTSNPAVTLVFATRGEFPWRGVVPYIIVQCLGGIVGTAVAHLMFNLTPLAVGTTARSGASQWFAEFVATFTLIFAILGGLRYSPQSIPWLVGLTITAAYWFTSSTSFANPAVTLARGFTTTFAGIAINHVPGFVIAQLIGALAAALASTILFRAER